MPTYAYRCPDGHEYDLLEDYDSPREHRCQEEKCRKTARRQLSAPAILFKGDGWTKPSQHGPAWDRDRDGYSKVSEDVKATDTD